MVLKRPCGHSENIPDLETKKKGLLKKGRLCRKCRESSGPGTKTGFFGRERLPRPMAMAMDLWNE